MIRVSLLFILSVFLIPLSAQAVTISLTSSEDGKISGAAFSCTERIYSIVDLKGEKVKSAEGRWRNPAGEIQETVVWTPAPKDQGRYMFWLSFDEASPLTNLFRFGEEENPSGVWTFELATGDRVLARKEFQLECHP